MADQHSRARFWWGISFLCNLVAVWFIQPLLVLLKMSGTIGTMTKAPAALIELEAAISPVTGSATVMAEIVCLIALIIGIAAASRAASEAG